MRSTAHALILTACLLLSCAEPVDLEVTGTTGLHFAGYYIAYPGEEENDYGEIAEIEGNIPASYHSESAEGGFEAQVWKLDSAGELVISILVGGKEVVTSRTTQPFDTLDIFWIP